MVLMATKAAIYPMVEDERYLSMLRATSAIASSNCDTAFETLTTRLREVTPFDYLHLVAFDRDTNQPDWCLLDVNGKRVDVPRVDMAYVEDTPLKWAYDSGEPHACGDWNQETRFQKHQQFLAELGIASTCT